MGTAMTETAYREQAAREGYGEPVPLSFEPNLANERHTHEFTAFLYVTEGEFELHTDAGVQRSGPGECCQLDANTLHSEHTGASGAKGLIAKK